jgi:hypothetical protein
MHEATLSRHEKAACSPSRHQRTDDFSIGEKLTVPGHNRYMGHHACKPKCEYQIDLDAAIEALNESSRLLSASIFAGSDELIQTQFAAVKVSWIKVSAMFAAWRDHLEEA